MAEENNQQPAAQAPVVVEPLMCDWPGCARGPFQSLQARNVHIARTHKKKWVSVPRGAKKKHGRFVKPVKKVASPPQEKAASDARPRGWDPRVVLFCPCCGTNVRNVQAAVSMGG